MGERTKHSLLLRSEPAALKGWHNKVGGRSFILIEIHESLCLTHVCGICRKIESFI